MSRNVYALYSVCLVVCIPTCEVCAACCTTDISQLYICHRVVHGSDGPAGRVGSGPDFTGFWRVGSGQHFGFVSFLLIIYWYLNRYEFSNTTFGLIDFLRYSIYIHLIINK